MIKLKPIICGCICVAVCAVTVFSAFGADETETYESSGALTLWQIDSFEGGKGSRASYLQSAADRHKREGGAYVKVIALSADAARQNIADGVLPDIISFGAGEYGFESVIDCNYGAVVWCRGAYCILTVDGDFSDVTSENTVVNEGKNNLASAAALMCGLQNAAKESATSAYVNMLNGKYKYLLGTQRDIFRLNTRGVQYSAKAVTQFNDLYQLIAVCSDDKGRKAEAGDYILSLLGDSDGLYGIGMLGGALPADSPIKVIDGVTYDFAINSPLSTTARTQIENCITKNDVNTLKTLLK